MKKHLFLTILIFSTSSCIFSQSLLSLIYDEGGNRIKNSTEGFNCPPENGKSNEPSVSRLEIFPNPASTQTILSFRVEEAGQLRIMVFSATNIKVKEVYSGAAVVDNYQFNIDLGNLPSAIYFVQLRLADRAKNYKLVVIH